MCADALWLVNALQWEVVESNALHATLLQLQPGWRTVGVDIWWRRHLAVAVGEWLGGSVCSSGELLRGALVGRRLVEQSEWRAW